MLRIAVVEDDPAYTKQLQEYLARYAEGHDEKLKLTCFTDGDEIALGYKADYDIILMDIEMTFMDGMTAAEEIRKLDGAVIIIFITNSPQYAIKGYAVNALDYVLKPLSYYAFSQRIDRARSRMQRREQKFIMLSARGGGQKLNQAEITYVSVDGHELIYHTKTASVRAQGTMRDAECSLDAGLFFRCNKGFLVNLAQVDAIKGEDAVVGGEAVQISRSKRKSFLDALNNYINGSEK